MWYGNATQAMKSEAERISNKLEQERRQAQIARWVALGALRRLSAEVKFKKEVMKVNRRQL